MSYRPRATQPMSGEAGTCLQLVSDQTHTLCPCEELVQGVSPPHQPRGVWSVPVTFQNRPARPVSPLLCLWTVFPLSSCSPRMDEIHREMYQARVL